MKAIRARPSAEQKIVELHGKEDVDAFTCLDALSKKRSAVNREYDEQPAKWLARGAGADKLVCGDRQIDLKRFQVKDYHEEQENE